MQVTTSLSGFMTPFDDEAVTVSTVAKNGLTAAKYFPTGSAPVRDMGPARAAVIAVEGRIRFRMLGTTSDVAAATGSGQVLNDGDQLVLSSMQQFKNFRVIRHEGETADAVLFITYYR